jgi:hydroxypyruvate reductase
MADTLADILLITPVPFLVERFAGRVVQRKEAADLDEAGRAAIRVIVGDGNTPITAADMDAYPNLGLIVTIAAGHDGVDKAAAAARGIPISSGVGSNSDDVADHALALLLSAARYILANDTKIRTGGWKGRGLRPVPSVSSLKVGIVGLGSIGKAIAARLEPFRCEIAWSGPRPKPDVALRYEPTWWSWRAGPTPWWWRRRSTPRPTA